MRFFWDVWLKITQPVCDKKLVCFLVKSFFGHAGIAQLTWTCPPFSRLPFAKFTKERFMKEKIHPSPPSAFCILSNTDWPQPNI